MKNLNKKELYAKVENIKSIFNDIDKLSILKIVLYTLHLQNAHN